MNLLKSLQEKPWLPSPLEQPTTLKSALPDKERTASTALQFY